MADKQEKGLLARTATYTSKKARRAQTKLKQRVGKGDETKDEVFDEFVLNFNKQQASATRLHNELKNYMRCLTAMQVAHENFSEAVKEIYEDDWTSRSNLLEIFKEYDNNWTTIRNRVNEEVLEPLTSYLKPFPDVKHKISKRARKLVDYDHSRHSLDTLRAKGATKTSEQKKLSQAEEEYQKAKDVFIDLTSELYEELPALYDSRIGFYVSCFQSIFTLQEVFHREAAQLNHQLNDLMDSLIRDFSAGTYSTRKPFSAGLENSMSTLDKEKDSTKVSSGSLAQFYDVAVPDEGQVTQDESQGEQLDQYNNDYIDSSDQALSDSSAGMSLDRSGEEELNSHVPKYPSESCDENSDKNEQPPQKPPPPPSHPHQSTATTMGTEETVIAMPSSQQQATTPVKQKPPVSSQPQRPAPCPPSRPPIPSQPALLNTTAHDGSGGESNETVAPDKSKHPDQNGGVNEDLQQPIGSESNEVTNENQSENGQQAEASTVDPGQQQQQSIDNDNEVNVNEVNPTTGMATNVIAYRNTPSAENPCNLLVPHSLYKVIATHKYTPEDEDELSFEKGEIIHVIPYDDPEEQDDGWLMGVMDSNGYVGVFPENFSRRL